MQAIAFRNRHHGRTKVQNGFVKVFVQALEGWRCQIEPDFIVVQAWQRQMHICDSPIQECEIRLKEQLANIARFMTRSDMQCMGR